MPPFLLAKLQNLFIVLKKNLYILLTLALLQKNANHFVYEQKFHLYALLSTAVWFREAMLSLAA